MRYTKIMFGAKYDTGVPDPGSRIDPNRPALSSGSQHWPHRNQPFRSWPNSVAVTPNVAKLYVSLPGREGYPDWRVAVVNTSTKQVSRWIDLRPSGPLVFGLELRRLRTTYATGDFTANHLNVAAGFQF